MFNRTKATVPVTVSHDILQEKQNEIARLTRQANEAVDLVSRTINSLEDINQQIDSAISEIDAYSQGLAAARASMSKERDNNAAIIANFSKLLNIGTEKEQ